MMEVCRACLLTENDMMPLNITFVDNYNLLTNLNVTLCDGMPQFVCQNCSELLKCFIEFRTKCISSETTLREVVENIKPDDLDLQLENKISNIEDDNLFKQEIKIELRNEPHTFDYFSDHYDDNDNANFDIKPDFTDVNARKSKRITKTKQYALTKRNTKIKIKKGITEGESVKDAKPKKYKNKKIKDTDFLDEFLSCGICQIKFEEKNALKSHLETHLNSRRCDICYEQFKTWQQLFGHRIQHLPKQERWCHICDKRHMACANLEFHYLTVHGDGQEVSISCKYCEKSYSNPLKLKKHMASVHSQREKKFICDYCSKSFIQKALMRKHIQVSHTDIRPYACDLCGYSCKTKSNLVAHAAIHSPDKVNCKKCTKCFMNKKKFDEHTCQVKTFICPICGKLMPDGRQVMFKRHMATHDPEGRFKCDRCPRRFRGRGGLQAHLNRHDGNRTEKCELCVAQFYTRSSLIRHRRIHTGEKPYGCNICSKKFMSNSNLKTHMKVHGIFIINHRNKDPEDAE